VKLNEQILASLRGHPDSPAIEFEGRWRPWSAVAEVAFGLDAALQLHGLGAGTRVGLVARNRPPQISAFAGALATERCVVMIYSAQANDAIADDIRRMRLPVVVADRQDWTPATVAAAQEVGSLGFELTHDAAHPIKPVAGLEQLSPELETQADPAVAMELLSSGTTGAPKRVPLSRVTFEQAVADSTAVYASGRSDVVPSPHVVFHPLGNVAGVTFLIPFLVQGQSVVLLEKFSLPKWLDAVARHQPARASLPPTALRMILDAEVPKAALSSLASIGVGAAPLDPALQQQFEATYGIPLLAGYGATEFCGVVANWTLDLYKVFAEAKRGSVGKPRPGVSLRVIDTATGREIGAGEVGVLEALVLRVGPDWIRTTDLASIDADGFLFLHGRADSAINRGGFKVLPDEVAQILRLHPAVADAVVIGLADKRLGQVPVAAVEPREGVTAPTEEELLAYARRELVAYQVPTRIMVLPSLPRNPSMKVSLPDVRALFTRGG
jgi:long-chain acyl-CoA synthetase